MSNEPHEGANPKKQIFNEPVELNCVSCGHTPVIWIERILLEGSLELYYVVHTEVNDVFECPDCHHKWEVFGNM